MSSYDFHICSSDLGLNAKIKAIVSNFLPEAEIFYYEKKEGIPKVLDHSVLVVDHDHDYFEEHFIGGVRDNLLIVVNEIMDDLEDFPVEAFVTKKRLLTSMTSLLFDLKLSSETQKEYFPISIEKIAIGCDAPCDLFLKINEEKFLKCLHTGDEFDIEARDRFEKKAELIWVKKEDFYQYGNFLYGRANLEDILVEEFSVTKADHLELIHDMAKSCGITEKTIRSVTATLDRFQENSKGQMKSLFANFEKSRGTFLYSHSQLTALLVIEVASKFKWYKHQHIDKLVLASVLHDLGYDNPTNSLNESLTKSKVMELPPGVKEDTLYHVDVIVEQLEKINDIDSDILNIIRNHHGARGDESYPKKSHATEMDLLSGIFLLCHSFSICLFKVAFNLKKRDQIFIYIDHYYNKGNLRKLVPEFKKIITELMPIKSSKSK